MRAITPRQFDAGRRSGITLTEILIAILIMGVGLVSLATLFPLGLLRAQRAMRDSRSTLWAESAISEINARNLFNYESFWFCGWYGAVDPWAADTAAPRNAPATFQAGLPVCYDPLWWSIVHQQNVGTPLSLGLASRFGVGNGTAAPNTLAFLRQDPDGRSPAANGLQRITNFRAWNYAAVPADPYEFVYNPPGGVPVALQPGFEVASEVFGSPDNIIFNGEDQEFPGQKPGDTSPLVPDLSLSGNGTMTYDLTFTWFFTGQRSNVGDPDQYVGSIVVCHNRVMGVETITAPITGNPVIMPIGERTVEAIWGYGNQSVKQDPPASGLFYGTGDRTVLLRWSNQFPDPSIRTGSYIADVTYDVDLTNANPPNLRAMGRYPGQRCDWYRIAGYTTPTDDPVLGGFRSTVVTLETSVRSKTLVNAVGQPIHLNAALIMPSVVNVVPRSFTSRGSN